MSQLVYPILDIDTCRKLGLDPVTLPARWIDAGLTFFQLRFKNAAADEYLKLAERLRETYPSARLIANDYARIAHRSGLFSMVHVGQEDVSELEYLRSAGFPFGLSTHNLSQFKAALDLPLAYTALGPMRPTASKPGGRDPVVTGQDAAQCMDLAAEAVRNIVLIGGISKASIAEVAAPALARGFVPAAAFIQAALDPAEIAGILAFLESQPGRRAGLALQNII